VRKRTGRKLLVATLGVAAVSYVACGGTSVANLMPPPQDAGADTAADTAADTSSSDTFSPLDLVANIVAPQ
jgi:Na+/H+-dicarboxylate symporter